MGAVAVILGWSIVWTACMVVGGYLPYWPLYPGAWALLLVIAIANTACLIGLAQDELESTI
jgi:hypothetical protein